MMKEFNIKDIGLRKDTLSNMLNEAYLEEAESLVENLKVDISNIKTVEPTTTQGIMSQVSLLLMNDYDNQIKETLRQNEFVKSVKERYQIQIQNIDNFLASQALTTKDGKRYYEMTPEGMQQILTQLKVYDYEESRKFVREESLSIKTSPYKHMDKVVKAQKEGIRTNEDLNLEENMAVFTVPVPEAGKTKASDWNNVFENLKGPKPGDEYDVEAYYNIVMPKDSSKSDLPFFKPSKDVVFETGELKVCVWADSVESWKDQLRGKMEIVDKDSERLTLQLQELISQRKNLLDNASQINSKQNDAKSQIIGKGN